MKAGTEAGLKLRKDPALQKMEASRTGRLSSLRRERQESVAAERAKRLDDEGMLRKKV